MKIDYKKVRRSIFIFLGSYFIIFILYLSITRTPSYFSCLKVKGVVAYVHHHTFKWKGRLNDRIEPVINYTVGDSVYIYDDRYTDYRRTFEAGDSVTIVYEPSDPGKAALVSPIGYWITTNEAMFSIIFCVLIVSLIKVLYTPRIHGGNNESDDNNEDNYVVLPSNQLFL